VKKMMPAHVAIYREILDGSGHYPPVN
jgi:hypothetical protein